MDTSKDIESFRIQYLRPDTLYITQVRCKNAREGYGYWSDWSTNATARTPEDGKYHSAALRLSMPLNKSFTFKYNTVSKDICENIFLHVYVWLAFGP